MKLFRKNMNLPVVLGLLILISALFTPRLISEERQVVFNDGLAQQSIAWQIEELAKWLIKSRDLIPRPEECTEYCFTIDTLNISGSIEKNRLLFSLNGHVLSDDYALIPLFSQPKKIGLLNVTVNNKPAIVGFEDLNHYFVRTAEKDFVIKGELEFREESNLNIVGPVNSFYGEIEDGRIVQGNKLAGLRNTLIHIESTKARPVSDEPEIKPLFQLNRSFRITDEIAFEYHVYIRSGTEISNYIIPLKNSEIVLDVRGVRDWKLEKDRLIINSNQKSIQCIITGNIKSLEALSMDERSGYEWWLIESDPQHRISVKTTGKQIDSSESPIPRKMSLSRLYFMTKGNEISISVQKLKSLEALAAVVHSQKRKIVWTKDGDIVAYDTLTYENSGVDYLVFDTKGKPIYLEIDNSPQRLLSQDDIPETAVLLPLLKGKHNVFIQNIAKSEINHLGGSLELPSPEHSFTISNGYIEFGLPDMIIPLYFTEGTGFLNPFSLTDIILFIIIIIISFYLFKSRSIRFFSVISLAGIYLLLKGFFIALLILAILIKLVFYLRKKYSKKTFLLIIIITAMALISLLVYSMILPSLLISGRSHAGYDQSRQRPEAPSMQAYDEYEQKTLSKSEERWGQRDAGSIDYDKLLREDAVISDSSIVEGIIPVALPMPKYDYSLYAYKELITKDRPLAPRLLYITRYTLIPVYLLWLISLLILIRHLYPEIRPYLKRDEIKKQEPE